MYRPNISIIGTGRFGAILVEEIFRRGFANEIILQNRTQIKAEALAEELTRMSPLSPKRFRSKIRVAADASEIQESEIIVVCAKEKYEFRDCLSKGDVLGAAYLRDFAIEKDSKGIADLARSMREFCGLVVIVTNPVEYMVSLWTSHNKSSRRRILGLGLSLDSARVKPRILATHPDAVLDLIMLGAHGADAFLADKASLVNGKSLKDMLPQLGIDPSAIVKEANMDAVRRVLHHGFTSFEPAFVFAQDIEQIVKGRTVNVSAFYGNSTVALGGMFRWNGSSLIEEKIPLSEQDIFHRQKAKASIEILLKRGKKWFR